MFDKSRIQLQAMDPRETIVGITKKCKDAKEQGYSTIEVAQWFVPFVKKELSNSKVLVSTCVGLPGGETSTYAKHAEVKQAVANGVDEVSIPVNMRLIQEGNLEAAKSDFNASMCMASRKINIKAVLEVDQLNDIMIGKVIDMLLELNIDAIVLSSVISGNYISKKRVSSIKDKIKNTKLMILGGVFTETDAESLFELGADAVVSSRI